MENNEHVIKINLPGGIVSPGDLYEILEIAEKHHVENIRFGNRQQLLFKIKQDYLEDLKDSLWVNGIIYEADEDKYPNIASSYVTEEIFPTSLWLTEGVYKDIIDGFNHQPQLKINIVDYYQNLIPFFTGNLNFIASEVSNFWYLYIRFPKTNFIYCWRSLVYSEDIPEISKIIEKKIHQHPDKYSEPSETEGEELYLTATKTQFFLHQPYERSLVHTDFQLPYYEGLNKYGDNKLWLGIYRRKEEYPLAFLKEVCEICQNTRIGQLYTTAWKTLVIKDISNKDRHYWSNLLNKYRINIRHSANELNWQTEDLCDEALALKSDLVKQFEEADLRTYRLCFAIKTQPRTGLFGCIVIRKRNSRNTSGEELFELLYTRDFNPNSKDYILFDNNANRKNLGNRLMEICYIYYTLSESKETHQQHTNKADTKEEKPIKNVYQCKHCLTVYDEQYGDSVNNIAPGVPFSAFSVYNCPTCDAPKTDFVQTALKDYNYGC